MNYLVWLVPVALGMGVAGLLAFLWSIGNGQYEDLDGAAERVLLADAADQPLRHRDKAGLPKRRTVKKLSQTKHPMKDQD